MKIRIFLSVLAGIFIGIGAMWFLVLRNTGIVFANQYLIAVMDQANVALHIRAGKQMGLLTNIQEVLPSYALTVDREFRNHPGSTNALWMIKAYYTRSELAIPPEIKDIMDALPVQPPTACQIRLRALDESTNRNVKTIKGTP